MLSIWCGTETVIYFGILSVTVVIWKDQFKVRYIFASLFLSLKESTYETKKNVFYLTLKALELKNFRYSNFMKS